MIQNLFTKYEGKRHPYKTREGGATVTILSLMIVIIIVHFALTRKSMQTWRDFQQMPFVRVSRRWML